ncbi:MAG: YIP1 family protein [Albidovulum sp.]
MTGLNALLVDLLAQTLRDPQGAARRLMDLRPPMEARWLGLFLVTVIGFMFTKLASVLFPAGQEAQIFGFLVDPMLGLPVQAGSLVLMSFAMAYVGRIFGGNGTFADALLLVVWLQFLLTLLQTVQFIGLLVLPPLATVIGFGSIVLFLWLMTQFIKALHGFANTAKVVIGMIVSFFAIVVVLALVFMALGITPPLQKV